MSQRKVSQEIAGPLSEVQMGNQYRPPSEAFSGSSGSRMETASEQNQAEQLKLGWIQVPLSSVKTFLS